MSEKFIRRSLLYMPGSSLKMLGKAPFLPADSIIMDLEDAVSITEKEQAREYAAGTIEAVKAAGKEAVVRVNALDTLWGVQDILAVSAKKPDAIVVPKADEQSLVTADTLLWAMEQELGLERYSIKMIPLLETAYAIVNAYPLLGLSPRIDGVHLGGEDLAKDLEVIRTPKGEELRHARCQTVFAARARGIDVLDSPYTAVKDLEGLREDCGTARQIGFSGKTCIHPSHIDAVNEVFSPTSEEVEYSKGLIDAYEKSAAEGLGAFMYKGKMVDAPIAGRAKRIVMKAGRIENLKNG